MTTPPASGDDTALTQRLATANGFDFAALAENRAGRLTTAQRRWLRTRQRSSTINNWMVPRLGCLVAVGFLGYGLHAGTLSTRDAMSVAFLAVVAGWVGFVMPRFGRFRDDVKAGVVAHADGTVTRREESAGAYHVGQQDSSYYYLLGERRFRVSAAGYHALVEGRRYRIYYLPNARADRRQVLSPMVNIEALGP